MLRKHELQIVDYYSAKDKYIHSLHHSKVHHSVYTKEKDKYQFLVLEQKGPKLVEVQQMDSTGKVTAWDHFELTDHHPKLVHAVRLHSDGYGHIPFDEEEIKAIFHYAEETKEATCAKMAEVLSQIEDLVHKDTLIRREVIQTTMEKLTMLTEESCMSLASSVKRRMAVE